MNSTIEDNHFICLSVSNTSKACRDLSVNTSTRWNSLGVSCLSKPLSQEVILSMSGDGCFATEENDIHCSRCHRTVSFKDTENYLISLDSNRHVFHNDRCEMKDGIHNTKKSSIQRQLYGFVAGYFITMFGHMIENGLKGADCNPSLVDVCPLMTRICCPLDFYLTPHIILAVQIGTVLYTLANIPCGEAKINNANATDTDNVIEVDNFETLKKIGKHKDYPSDGHYKLINNLVGTTSTSTYPPTPTCSIIQTFSGSLDGAGYIISGHSGCLISKLENHGIVGNIIFDGANIIDASNSPLVVNTMSEHAMLKNIRISNANIHTTRSESTVSVFAKQLFNYSRIEDCSLISSLVSIMGDFSNFSIFAYSVTDNTVITNNAMINCNFDTRGKHIYLGSVLNMEINSSISNITATGCVFSLGSYRGYSTIGAVWLNSASQSNTIIAFNCSFLLLASDEYFSVGVGHLNLNGGNSAVNNIAIGCNFTGLNRKVTIAVGAGLAFSGQINNNVIVNSNLKTMSDFSVTAIGIGESLNNIGGTSNNIVINTISEIWGYKKSYFSINIGRKPDSLNSNYTIINSTFRTPIKLRKVEYSGANNISTICQGLSRPTFGILNDNCSLNQQTLNSYVNEITTWNTTVLDIERVVKNQVPITTMSVTMSKESVVTTETPPDSGSVTTFETSSLTPTPTPTPTPTLTEILLISAITGIIISWLTRSYCRAYKKGKRGVALIRHPINTCIRCFNGTATLETQRDIAISYSAERDTVNNESPPLYEEALVPPSYEEALVLSPYEEELVMLPPPYDDNS